VTTCNPYLSFNGNCRDAFEFYERVLDGKILMMQSNGESPIAEHVPPAAHDLIMHARLEFDGQILMGGDAPPDRTTKPSGFMVAVGVDSVDRAERIFNALAEGGSVQMPFQPTFWAKKFGMVTDRYGTPWVINGEPQM
jgi:PhnB protein